MQIIELSIGELKPYKNNPRKNDQAVDAVAASISEFGFKIPIIIDKNKEIVAGHTRLKAAIKLGLVKVPCIIADDLTPEQIKAFRLADNKTAELSDWDLELLSLELEDIQLDMSEFGFYNDAVSESEPFEDEFEVNVPQEPKTKLGDVLKLGNHLLLCGDATQKESYEKLIGSTVVDMLLTDPPYNVALGMGGSKDDARKRHRRMDGLVIMNDKMSNDKFFEFLLSAFKCAKDSLKEGGAFYIWHADNVSLTFRSALEASGLSLRQTLIWNKNSFTLGRQDYQWKHEPCLYGWKDGAAHYFADDRTQATVIDEDKPTRNEDHPTMKPVKLLARFIKNSTKLGESVLDPYGTRPKVLRRYYRSMGEVYRTKGGEIVIWQMSRT